LTDVLSVDPSPRWTRRAVLRRVGIAAGVLVAGTSAFAFAEGDYGPDADRSLYAQTLGDTGPTVAFLPGLGATTRYWNSRVAELQSRARLLLIDLLGFGRSPKPWTTYSVERHVVALHEIIAPAAAVHGPVVLVGHSVGARLAVAYAAHYPREIRQLVLVSLPYYGDEERTRGFFARRGAQGWITTHTLPLALSCLFTRRVLGPLLPRIITNVPADVAEDLTQMTWRSSTSTTSEVIFRYDVAADVQRINGQIPLLCLHGDRDDTAPLSTVRALAASHRGCELRVLPAGDHHLVLRHPAWVREQIASVL